jgi:hypothetical protein
LLGDARRFGLTMREAAAADSHCERSDREQQREAKRTHFEQSCHVRGVYRSTRQPAATEGRLPRMRSSSRIARRRFIALLALRLAQTRPPKFSANTSESTLASVS